MYLIKDLQVNKSNWEHVAIALAIQFLYILGITALGKFFGFGLLWIFLGAFVGAVAATHQFLGREHAQREYKIGDPSKLIGYEAFDFHKWSKDALLDLLVPVGTVWSVVFLIYLAY